MYLIDGLVGVVDMLHIWVIIVLQCRCNQDYGFAPMTAMFVVLRLGRAVPVLVFIPTSSRTPLLPYEIRSSATLNYFPAEKGTTNPKMQVYMESCNTTCYKRRLGRAICSLARATLQS